MRCGFNFRVGKIPRRKDVSSPDFPWARSDSDRSFAAEFEQESQASSCVDDFCLSAVLPSAG